MKYSIFSILLAVFLVSSVSAQKVPDKPLTQWSKDESLRIVTDSPWAKPYQSAETSASDEAGDIARERQLSRVTGTPEPYRARRSSSAPLIRIRLHSGLPLRQAMVRLQQIDAGYEAMNDAKRAAFDASKKAYLDCAICKDYHVIAIYRDRDASRSAVEEGVFQGMTFEDLVGRVRLESDKSESRELVQFNAPKGPADPAVLYFKRTNDAGKDLVGAETRSFKIVFTADFRSSKNRFAFMMPNTFEFKVDKLMMGETLMF